MKIKNKNKFNLNADISKYMIVAKKIVYYQRSTKNLKTIIDLLKK